VRSHALFLGGGGDDADDAGEGGERLIVPRQVVINNEVLFLS
jgi:hypothetical protein